MASNRSGWPWGATLGIALCACAAPQLAVLPEPDTARVLVDGREFAASRPTPLPYYGTLEIRAENPREPGRRLGPDDRALGDTLQRVEVAPPLPAWLYPLDFAWEFLSRPFRGSDDVTVRPVLPEIERTVPGFLPARSEEVRARAAAMRTSRGGGGS